MDSASESRGAHALTFCCLCILLLILSIPGCEGTIYQIDSAYPYLSINGISIEWSSGAALQRVLSSLLVRVHPRGVVFKKQGWHLRELSRAGWKTEHCPPSGHGLCQTAQSVLFPSALPPEVNEGMAGMCGSSGTARVITNETRYDASACDVLDRRIDYVYANEVIYYLDTSLPAWIYWTVCVGVIFLVRCLSRYILASLSPNPTATTAGGMPPGDSQGKATPDPWVSLAASGGCTALILSQGDRAFVTHEDMIFHWFTVLYVCAYAGQFLGVRVINKISRAAIHDPPFYNLLAGVLQLVATQLYAGAETPYNPPLVFIIAVRALAKSRREVNVIRGVTLLLDACMLSLMCTLGFGLDAHYLIAIFTAALAWTDMLQSC